MNEIQTKTKLQRFKEGVAMITPLQSLQATQKGNWIMLLGYVGGIITMLWNLKSWWWIELILGAGLFNHSLMMFGQQQKINMLIKMEEEVN